MQLLFQPTLLLEVPFVSSVPMISTCLELLLLDSLTCCPLGGAVNVLLLEGSHASRLFPVPQDPVTLCCIPVAVMTSSPLLACSLSMVSLRAQRGAVPKCVTDPKFVSLSPQWLLPLSLSSQQPLNQTVQRARTTPRPGQDLAWPTVPPRKLTQSRAHRQAGCLWLRSRWPSAHLRPLPAQVSAFQTEGYYAS